jgi:hypothetical protein
MKRILNTENSLIKTLMIIFNNNSSLNNNIIRHLRMIIIINGIRIIMHILFQINVNYYIKIKI